MKALGLIGLCVCASVKHSGHVNKVVRCQPLTSFSFSGFQPCSSSSFFVGLTKIKIIHHSPPHKALHTKQKKVQPHQNSHALSEHTIQGALQGALSTARRTEHCKVR